MFIWDRLVIIAWTFFTCIKVEVIIMWTSIKLKWRDIQPSMVTHTRNACSAFTHPKCTHTAVNTHPGSSWGFGAFLKGISVVVLKVERVLYIHSPHRQSLPARDSNLQPFDYESNSLPLGHYFPVLVIPNISKCKLQQMFVCFAFPFAPIAK